MATPRMRAERARFRPDVTPVEVIDFGQWTDRQLLLGARFAARSAYGKELLAEVAKRGL